MDPSRFDTLVRSFAGTATRRGALTVLAAALTALPVPGSDAKNGGKGKGKGKHRGKGHGKGTAAKVKDRHRKRTKSRQTQTEAVCFGGSPCTVGPNGNLAKCDLSTSAVLQNAVCTSCNLSGANLTKANASNANLKSANLGKACLVDANLTGANLASTNVSGAIFCRTTMPNGTINNAGCGKATSCCPTCNVALGGSCAEPGAVCCGGATCQSGTCACPTGQVECGGACVEPIWANQTIIGSGPGSGPNQFNGPFAVAVSPDGQTLWVADTDNNRVSIWAKSGSAWTNVITFGGGPGSGASQFDRPYGVAVSPDGQTVWVADTFNHRIAVWSKTGPSTWVNLTTFGSGPGSGPSQFNAPFGVAVSPDGQTVWVADVNNNRVSVWTKTGPTTWANMTTFGGVGAGPSQFALPYGVAVAPDGQTVWVADTNNNRISIWGKTGPTTWGNLTTFGSAGSSPNQFSSPYMVAVSPDGQTVWISDTVNSRVSVWTRTGPTTWRNQTTFGSAGSGPSQFASPFGVAVTLDGQTVWVGDRDNNRVAVWALGCPAL